MGYMTVVSILNDGWSTIKNHPDQFIENIEMGMNGSMEYNDNESRKMINYYPVAGFCNPMEVAKSFHADTPQVFYVGQNCMTMLTDWTAKDKHSIDFQLERIKQAKSILNYQQKELKKKQELIRSYSKATELICKSDYKQCIYGKVELLCKAGDTYKILNKRNEDSYLIIETIKENDPIMIETIEAAKYFNIKEFNK